ncbi:MAG: phosphoribosyltransferase [Flammeovirgaceae bacterium]|nr:phosphoribosyltransferase [Flammeovirgaceae bacterium]|tara:strand:+ start:830 stop:1324 length:495 start_codon:yes stop_codon:yes gene_type:complete
MKNIVLDSNDIINKIRRISFEIIEKNIDEKEIYLIGILPNGKYLSQKINSFIIENSSINVNLHFIDIDKKNLSIKEISFESDADEIKNKVIVLVDDVMNSASTFMYSINEILKYQPKEIQVAVLIERYYKSFPITPNFRGLELSTSKSEHVQVDLGNSPKVLIL